MPVEGDVEYEDSLKVDTMALRDHDKESRRVRSIPVREYRRRGIRL